MTQSRFTCWLSLFVFGILSVCADPAENWSEWRGPRRDGRALASGLLREWPAGGPAKLWSAGNLGEGYSSPIVHNDTIYVTAYQAGTAAEELVALGLDGAEKWRVKYAAVASFKRYAGARTTPAIASGRLFVFSSNMELVCLDPRDGKEIWRVDTGKNYGAHQLPWVAAESPLVHGNLVYCTPGGDRVTLVALAVEDGKEVWKLQAPPLAGKQGKKAPPRSSYCSPLLIERGGRKLLVSMLEGGAVGVDAISGALMWEIPHRNQRAIHPNTPVYSNGVICIASGYNYGGEAWRLSEDGAQVEKLWSSKDLAVQHGGMLHLDDTVVAAADRGWVCIELATGKVLWKQPLIGKGTVTYADGMLFGYSEKGVVALVHATREGARIAGQFQVDEGEHEHWAHLVVHGGRLYVRHGSRLLAYAIAIQD